MPSDRDRIGSKIEDASDALENRRYGVRVRKANRDLKSVTRA